MDEKALARVRIVLVEPAGALNVGAIARVMKNMGLQQLVLVNPRCDRLGSESRQMAVRAADILESARVAATIPEALQGCTRAIATTARDRALDTRLEAPRSALCWLLEAPSALIFGPESRGLTNEELNYAQRFVRIPTSNAYSSLNLAQAVAVCSYELYQNAIDRTHQLEIPPSEAAPLEVLEGYYQQLEAVLLKIGYLYPHTAPARMEKFRRLFNRALPTPAEVTMLRGILSQVEWAIERQQQVSAGSSPPTFGNDRQIKQRERDTQQSERKD